MLSIRRMFAIAALAAATLISPMMESVHANEKVYKNAVRSTALIITDRGRGSGSLVDVDKRLVVTAYHVTGTQTNVSVVFPEVDDKGRVITESTYYQSRLGNLKIPGNVIKRDKNRDVAVIQLSKLPAGIKAIPLAKESPRPGQDIHCIGSAAYDTGGMFGYCYGKVRNVFRRPIRGSQLFNVRVVETQIPTNKGDSGAPILNDDGELVAIVSQGTTGVPPSKGTVFYARQVVDHSVDISEIRVVLKGGDSGTIKSILSVDGELKQTDAKDRVRQRSFHKAYEIKLKQGKLYLIELTSRDFDTYLRLEDTKGKQLGENDDGGNGLNSRMVVRPARDDTYRVIVTTYRPGDTGQFQLSVVER